MIEAIACCRNPFYLPDTTHMSYMNATSRSFAYTTLTLAMIDDDDKYSV